MYWGDQETVLSESSGYGNTFVRICRRISGRCEDSL